MSAWSFAGLGTSAGGFTLGPVDLELGATETIAVLGRSGAGKTTLLRAVAGFQLSTRGGLRRDGVDLTGHPPERRGAVYVPQGLGLFPHRSVRDNVAYPFRVRGLPDATGRAGPLLERFGLESLARRRPATLSTGEQQRVALARALAAEPELLLWDEPLGALDVVARDELLAALRVVRDERAMPLLFVTHDPALAYSLADRWLVLDSGRVEYLGDPAGLLESPTDRFTARFSGLENVFAPEELTTPPRGPFRSALLRSAGPLGVGFGVPTARPPGPASAYRATIVRVEPGPDGVRLTARCEGLPLRLRQVLPPGSRGPKVGETVEFDLEATRLSAIGRVAAPPEGRP